MRKRKRLLFSLAFVTAVLLTACSVAGVDQPTPTVDMSAHTENDTVVEDQPVDQLVVDTPTVEIPESQPEEATAVVEEVQPTPTLPVRPELGFANGGSEIEASDPNQVDFTSGQLHVVELFAFW